MANQGALATLDIDAALSELATGVLSKHIAQRWNVNPHTLRDKLKRANPEGYAQAIESQTDSMVEDATQYAMECSHKDDAPIARVRLDGAYRYAKARNPAVFGDKVQVSGTLDLRALLVSAYDPDALDGLTQRTIDVDQAGYVKSDVPSD